MALAQGRPPTVVKIGKVVEKQSGERMTFIGTVEPARTSVVGSAVDGRVASFDWEEGQAIKSGQPLAQLLDATISLEIAVAKAELKLREEELNELLAGSRVEEIRQAQARVDSAEALLKYAVAKHKRIAALFEKGQVATKEELDEALSQKIAAERTVEANTAAFDIVKSGERSEVIAQARARVESARQSVKLLEDRKSKYTIRAPFDGFITSKQAEKGAWVSRGGTIAEVMELREVDINVPIPETYISQVQVQDGRDPTPNVNVTLDSLPTKEFSGYIRRIVPRADLKSRSFPVKIRVANQSTADGRSVLLKPGMLAQVQLIIGKVRTTTFVAKDAIVLGGKSPTVFVLSQKDNKATVTAVTVELGTTDGPYIEVSDRSGNLRAGTQVVIEGNERLRNGSVVRVLSDSDK